jgi:hypothetical protein
VEVTWAANTSCLEKDHKTFHPFAQSWSDQCPNEKYLVNTQHCSQFVQKCCNHSVVRQQWYITIISMQSDTNMLDASRQKNKNNCDSSECHVPRKYYHVSFLAHMLQAPHRSSRHKQYLSTQTTASYYSTQIVKH